VALTCKFYFRKLLCLFLRAISFAMSVGMEELCSHVDEVMWNFVLGIVTKIWLFHISLLDKNGQK